MKKTLSILCIILLIIMVGCSTEQPKSGSTLTIYTVNDLHGSVENDRGGLGVLGTFLISAKEANPESTLILSSGDMWQGTAISNMSQGAVIVEAMNEIGFDAMTIGNHEFDWGIDVIRNYQNGEDLDSAVPFIAANIYDRQTNLPVDWAQPYTIVQKGDVRVGIIGLIGSNLESTIAPSIVAPYEFQEVLPIVKEHTKTLRTEQDVDVVILSIHGNKRDQHQEFADLVGEYKIDAVIDAHTHSTYAGETRGISQVPMPYVQAGSSGSHIGRIVLYLDANNVVYDGSASLVTLNARMASNNAAIQAIIAKYKDEVALISDEVLGVSAFEVNRSIGTAWAADVMQKRTQKDIGIINTGGIRASGFPILDKEEVTVGHVWEIMPFDNTVVFVDIQAKDIINVMSMTSIKLSANAHISGGSLYINSEPIGMDEWISVATIDFLFDNTNYPFLSGQNIQRTGALYRDYLIEDIRKACLDGSNWFAEAQDYD